MGFLDKSTSLLNMRGQGQGMSSEGNQAARNVYPALVISNQDPAGQNRIVARIVSLDENGEINGGRDRDKRDEDLPFCNPLTPEFLHVRPLEGEMVMIILENPSDNSAPRYWTGPIITSQLKLKYQAYRDANDSFKRTSFFGDRNIQTNPEAFELVPQQADIAIQGRDDADLILRPRTAILTVGKFEPGTLDPNITSPCSITIKQIDAVFNENDEQTAPRFSQTNVHSNSINIWSPIGKFRDVSVGEKLEPSNEALEYLGDLANSLHPVPFGDELVKLLDVLIRVMLNHIHHPQTELLETEDSNFLSEYTLEGRLQELLSNFVRIN